MPRLAAFVALLCLAGSAAPLTQQPTVVFENVGVIPMDRERLLANQTVIVSGGVITRIDTAGAVSPPPGALRIDGRGKFLIPALAEMHAHVPGGQEADRVLFLYAANGIGTIRSMLGDPSHFALRNRARRGELFAPAMYLAGPSFNGQTAGTPRAATARVDAQKRAGYDLLKIHPGVPLAAFNALAAEAARQDIRFAGHVPAAVGLQRALDARFWTIDHLDGYVEAMAGPGAPASDTFGVNLIDRIDQSRVDALAGATRAAGTWNVPTQILLEAWMGVTPVETMRTWPEMRYVDQAQVAEWVAFTRKLAQGYSAEQRRRFIAVRRRLIKALNDAGAGLLLGSDAPQIWNVPGFSAHRELETYVAAGLSPYEALATGTRNVAAHLGTLDRSGTIETGKRADLVLLDANPLERIGNTSRIAGVMLSGRWMGQTEIGQRLRELR